MISVAPSVPPVSVHQCHLSVPINATCQCPSMPHMSAYQCTSMFYQCPSELSISASQCCLTVPVSAT
ncbi:unnamed protein product [Staurois parvus]|uniref:Uncharacterized protein n=1 Tax=Staurois parvus TaxID=386267 RepID=A0ABN9FNC1_9NEOB|nr:unnamed protein product [Staurois parvus]CAI9597846.1 unnamed protein product [Staurois parvus]